MKEKLDGLIAQLGDKLDPAVYEAILGEVEVYQAAVKMFGVTRKLNQRSLS